MENKRTKKSTDALLEEIRLNFEYASDYWRPIREEARKDIRYISGDPWDAAERKAREDNHRPCITTDELNQYCNQAINDVRQNKRAIKVVPISNGANDQTAELRQNLIRGIEYKSNAQAAYTTAFENALQRSYGFFRVSTQYETEGSFNQELRIKRIPNPDTVWLDPDAKEVDCSDGEFAFVTDVLKYTVFKRKYPKAKVQSFTSEFHQTASQWIKSDSVQIAEYWKVEKKSRTLLLVNAENATGLPADEEHPIEQMEIDGEPRVVMSIYEDELPKGVKPEVLKSRDCEERKITQYLTNGVEILEENEWAGKYIPIVPVFGKELYVDDGSGSKRVLMSLIRLARDPQTLLCWLRSNQMEEGGMTPKTPFVGYEGQFEGHEDEWQMVNKVPLAFLQAKPILDSTGQTVLPLPQRQPFQPNFGAYEMVIESAKRAIQSAMGMYNTSVGKQDTNVKSGKAIQELQSQSSQGNFHFIDNFDRALEHAGRILCDLIPKIYDTARDVGIRKQDETHETIRLNDPSYVNPKTKQPEHHAVSDGEHDVTVSTGPSFDSQREEANNFVDMMVGNLATLPVDPAIKAKLLAHSIKLKNLGPIGDEMVEVLDPQDAQQNMPPQAMQAIQQGKQTVQALNAYAQQMEAKVQELQHKIDSKEADNAAKLEIIKIQEQTKILIAEINTKAQETQLRMDMERQQWSDLHGSSHEFAMQKDEQAHAAEMAQQNAANQQQMQAQQTEQAQSAGVGE